ncbi:MULTISPECIES: chromate efflux transporter [Thalassobaculum]|uniref:Chromate transporter n=1 Tax=Thalassobaculum litoreum DSM 18839 TaxID=1123362 RepID=A0A8G2BL83_9PROT|nr:MULTISPECIES: chromate efflux transporter [Thalassobaculum]SDG35624.1 chromate transporter [Thalassobaculum litoreum DSM 18839]
MSDIVNESAPATPGFGEALRVWLRIGLLSFGGPTAQIALMHREIVEERRWLNEDQFLNALNFCMLLPGPEAMQLATYAGWRLHGLAGGLAAGLLFVLPGAAVILALAALYATFGEVPLVDALFLGVKAAVVVIVIEALLRIARRTLSSPLHWWVAGLAFVAIFFLALPFPLIILGAAVLGLLRPAGPSSVAPTPAGAPALAGTAGTVAVWLVLWWTPVLIAAALDPGGLLTQIGVFFSKLAVVTFGGAYAVLAYMAQDVVAQKGWLTTGEMMDGLGLAETTPGPLILVTQFVGFLAAAKAGGLAAGVAGAAMALWVTFAPCFLWIFAGAPYIDWLAGRRRLRQALSMVTAAVVGVILNLSLWFAMHVFFERVEQVDRWGLRLTWPDPASLNLPALALFALAAVLAFRFHFGIGKVLVVAALGGLAIRAAGF